MAAIHLQNLVKHFGGFAAIKQMDLEIRDKEFMALLGPSGCGKSTTMNIIAGMENPSSGRVMFDGVDVSQVPMGKRGVGFVFQNYAIFTHMTVRQNLAYGLKVRRLPPKEIEEKVAKIAGLLQLEPYLDRPAAKLSVNILQRLAIGRSAAVNPSIFLLDEPLSNVDAAFRAVMRTELKHLQREFGQTMVYVTHDQLEAMTMADRIAVMDHGLLQQVGSPLEVYNNPCNTFVARFLGAPGMNLIAGTVIEQNGSLAVDCGPAGRSEALPAPLAAGLRKAGAKEVFFGVRPEDLEFASEGGAGLSMPVVFVERIGPRAILHLAAGDRTAKIVSENLVAVTTGERLRLVPRPGRVRLFDAGSGRAILEA
ncbi:MAG TPA: ABC transporter ATP-binding protein [Hypericibacter adhaerens]|uniref:ABC transporter ATP-binding protein n=1 Tax=Hypericibacter adhaerens TaxID=2602016 RepID=UPI002CD51594|nr:ABC transporter ATP-binding protein [Hypericibacter adhaerens]HWA44190.1 ABC transporter ATP-binding protein [Hypericibacter adhaerens]